MNRLKRDIRDIQDDERLAEKTKPGGYVTC